MKHPGGLEETGLRRTAGGEDGGHHSLPQWIHLQFGFPATDWAERRSPEAPCRRGNGAGAAPHGRAPEAELWPGGKLETEAPSDAEAALAVVTRAGMGRRRAARRLRAQDPAPRRGGVFPLAGPLSLAPPRPAPHPSLTALLSEEDQLELPQRVAELAAGSSGRGHGRPGSGERAAEGARPGRPEGGQSNRRPGARSSSSSSGCGDESLPPSRATPPGGGAMTSPRKMGGEGAGGRARRGARASRLPRR